MLRVETGTSDGSDKPAYLLSLVRAFTAVADPEGVLPDPIFKYPLVSVRPNYFIFIRYLRKMR